MVSMIKKYILPLVLLSSCTFIDYKQIPALTYRAIAGADDIPIDNDFIEQQEFSFAKVRIGKQSIAIMTLAKIEDNTFRWVSSTGEAITTKDGRIIKTSGLPHNINEISRTNLSDNTSESFIFLLDPEAIVIKSSTELYNFDTTNSFQENFNVKSIRWKGTNSFEFNERGLVTHSQQYIHPYLPMVEMTFYY